MCFGNKKNKNLVNIKKNVSQRVQTETNQRKGIEKCTEA